MALLKSAQEGVADDPALYSAFQAALAKLEGQADPWVQRVTQHLQRVFEQRLADGPYQRDMHHPWARDPVYPDAGAVGRMYSQKSFVVEEPTADDVVAFDGQSES